MPCLPGMRGRWSWVNKTENKVSLGLCFFDTVRNSVGFFNKITAFSRKNGGMTSAGRARSFFRVNTLLQKIPVGDIIILSEYNGGTAVFRLMPRRNRRK